MKRNIITYFVAFIVISLFSMCETYPKWDRDIEYSDTYPVSGEYYVRDFDFDADTLLEDWYKIYIYNKSYNPTKDSVWIDNVTGHPSTGTDKYEYSFKVKTKINKDALSFNGVKLGNVRNGDVNPLSEAISVTIENSFVIDRSQDITDATPDSIYFEFTYYETDGTVLKKIKTYGHRKTGWEEPEFDDPM